MEEDKSTQLKQVLSTMKDYVLVPRYQYDELLKNDAKVVSVTRDKRDINVMDTTIANLTSQLNELRQRYSIMHDTYNDLMSKVREYERTSWWQRHFG